MKKFYIVFDNNSIPYFDGEGYSLGNHCENCLSTAKNNAIILKQDLIIKELKSSVETSQCVFCGDIQLKTDRQNKLHKYREDNNNRMDKLFEKLDNNQISRKVFEEKFEIYQKITYAIHKEIYPNRNRTYPNMKWLTEAEIKH
jgi:hypothetical protein